MLAVEISPMLISRNVKPDRLVSYKRDPEAHL